MSLIRIEKPVLEKSKKENEDLQLKAQQHGKDYENAQQLQQALVQVMYFLAVFIFLKN